MAGSARRLVWIIANMLPAAAHHSFAAEFDIKDGITRRVTLTNMEWVTPHGSVYGDLKGRDGVITNCAIEGGGGNVLLPRGARNADFPEASRSSSKATARTTERPSNGNTVRLVEPWNLFTGSSGTENLAPSQAR